MTSFADLEPLERAKEQKAWYWYDWANSAYFTTMLSVMFAPYMIEVAGNAAGCPDNLDDAATCGNTVGLLGLDLAAGSLPFYLTSFATIFSALLLPIVGAMVDRSAHKKRHMAGFAWAGAASCSLLFFMKDDDWQIGAVAVVLWSVLAGCSVVSYSAILVDISTEAERDRVSSRGWAFGYLGGGVLLAVNLGIVPRPREHRADRDWPCGCRCSPRPSGGRRSRSSRSCGCATGRRSGWSRSRAPCSTAASASSSAP